jgi:hypothetical protein
MSNQSEIDLLNTKELFDFLQGEMPEGFQIPKKDIPRLTPDQAMTVIWYLGNKHWQVTDHIERCGVCGEIYDTWGAGFCLDYGREPYHFCDDCMSSEEFRRKAKRNPNRKERRAFLAGEWP